MRKVLTGILQAIREGIAPEVASGTAPPNTSTRASLSKPGRAPSSAPGAEPLNASTGAPSSATTQAPSGAAGAAPLNASIGAPSSATGQTPTTGAMVALPDALTRPVTDGILIPDIVGGALISELVLLPLHPYTEAEIRKVVSESAVMCERDHIPLRGILSGREKIGPKAAVHAFLLVQWWRVRGWDGDIFARDLRKMYFEFCTQRGLEPQSWRKMAVYMNFHTGSPGRVYRRDGTGKQLRYYPMGFVIEDDNC